MKHAYEGQPDAPGFYLRCGLWWTRVTPVHEYYTRAGELKCAFLHAASCDANKATRYNTRTEALVAKARLERESIRMAPHSVYEVSATGTLRNVTEDLDAEYADFLIRRDFEAGRY